MLTPNKPIDTDANYRIEILTVAQICNTCTPTYRICRYIKIDYVKVSVTDPDLKQRLIVPVGVQLGQSAGDPVVLPHPDDMHHSQTNLAHTRHKSPSDEPGAHET